MDNDILSELNKINKIEIILLQSFLYKFHLILLIMKQFITNLIK